MISQLVLKDVRRIIRDRKVLLIILVMPLVLTAILGFSVGQYLNSSIALDEFKVGIVQKADLEGDAEVFLDWGYYSLADHSLPEEAVLQMTNQLKQVDFIGVFTEEVLGNEEVKEFLSYEMLEEEEAKQQLKEGKLAAVLIIPERFYFNSWTNLVGNEVRTSEFQLLKQMDMEFSASIFEEITNSYMNRLNAAIRAKNAFLITAEEYGVAEEASRYVQPVMTKIMEQKAVVSLNEKTVDSMKSVSGLQYYSAAMSAMFMLFTAGVVSQFFISERRLFTYHRIMVAGTGLWRLVTSSFLTGAIITFFQLFILQVGTMLMFQIDWGSWSNLVGINVTLSLSVGVLAMFLSSLNFLLDDERATAFFENIVVQVMAFLGGSMLPMGAMPEGLAKAGNFLVNGLGLRAYLKNMQGYEIIEFQGLFLSLTLVSAVTFGVGMILFQLGSKRREAV